jgi:hypothetical protein
MSLHDQLAEYIPACFTGLWPQRREHEVVRLLNTGKSSEFSRIRLLVGSGSPDEPCRVNQSWHSRCRGLDQLVEFVGAQLRQVTRTQLGQGFECAK